MPPKGNGVPGQKQAGQGLEEAYKKAGIVLMYSVCLGAWPIMKSQEKKARTLVQADTLWGNKKGLSFAACHKDRLHKESPYGKFSGFQILRK